ncbi:MAG: yliJ [Myxococcaceae bacterium]|nr:yliJ [Myxococcaceae bacterium]
MLALVRRFLAMIQIWGRITSLNVRKVVLTAQQLGLTFERIDAGRAFGIVNTDAYRARNPNALVPLLVDGDFELWESNVIVRYLCAKHGSGSLYPEELRARFDAERWMDWQQTTLNPAGRDGFVQLIRTPEGERDQASIRRSCAAMEPLLALLDRHLTGRAFITGSKLTMADIPIACDLHRWRGLPLSHTELPELDRWYRSMAALPAARGVFDVPLA